MWVTQRGVVSDFQSDCTSETMTIKDGSVMASADLPVKKMARGISRVTDNHEIVFEARHQVERGFREPSQPGPQARICCQRLPEVRRSFPNNYQVHDEIEIRNF